MKIAVVGKGGVGKTTVSGTVARALSRAGRPVVAVDADTNPMLAMSLGLGPDIAESLVPLSQSVDKRAFEHEHSARGIIDSFGIDAPDGVRLLVALRLSADGYG